MAQHEDCHQFVFLAVPAQLQVQRAERAVQLHRRPEQLRQTAAVLQLERQKRIWVARHRREQPRQRQSPLPQEQPLQS